MSLDLKSIKDLLFDCRNMPVEKQISFVLFYANGNPMLAADTKTLKEATFPGNRALQHSDIISVLARLGVPRKNIPLTGLFYIDKNCSFTPIFWHNQDNSLFYYSKELAAGDEALYNNEEIFSEKVNLINANLAILMNLLAFSSNPVQSINIKKRLNQLLMVKTPVLNYYFSENSNQYLTDPQNIVLKEQKTL